jgi:hypothetical protein
MQAAAALDGLALVLTLAVALWAADGLVEWLAGPPDCSNCAPA